MNNTVITRIILVITWVTIGACAGGWYLLWLERRSTRGLAPAFNAWGALIVLGIALCLPLLGLALWLHHRTNNHVGPWALTIAAAMFVSVSITVAIMRHENLGKDATLHALELGVVLGVYACILGLFASYGGSRPAPVPVPAVVAVPVFPPPPPAAGGPIPVAAQP